MLMPRQRFALFCRVLAVLMGLLLGGCWSASGPEVVVYPALDEEFSQPIFDAFSAESRIHVRPKFDTESTKTAGLAEAIILECNRPRCDVFWNNEILHTLRLQQRGLLTACWPANAQQYPPQYRSPDGLWHGFAARARVLLVNTKLVEAADRPRSIRELADPKWRGRVGMAKPLFGTTATHAACLFAALGQQRVEAFFRQLQQNEIKILAGNKQVAMSVGSGAIAFGLTDTDDAIEEQQQGLPVAIVYPDQEEGGLGTLFIPNTLAVIKDCPNPAAARRLVDYLLSAEVEAKLAEGPSAQIPLNTATRAKARVETPQTIHAMQVDFQRAADQWDTAAQFLRDLFAGG
jgi:iron(III) transport system substrate-binding protein